jgi:hypothetical protein
MHLVEAGLIGRDELEAGLAFRTWHEVIGRVQTQRWTARVGGTPVPAGRTQRELTAARSLQAVRAALGARRTRLLVWCAVDDLSWVAIARKLGVDWRTAKLHAVAALEELARWMAGEASSRARRPTRSRRSPVAVEKIDQAS